MNVMTEEYQKREIEMRERVRRISQIVDRLEAGGIWKAAEEIEELQRKVLQLERDFSNSSGNGK